MSEDDRSAGDRPAGPGAFLSLRAGQGPEAVAAAAVLQFEQARVRWMIGRLGLGALGIRRAYDAFHARTGRRELCFDGFNWAFSTFPFVLGASTLRGLPVPWGSNRRTSWDYELHNDPYSTEPSRCKRFDWVPFVIAYGRLYDTVAVAASASVRKVALVFPRKGFAQGMVVHDDDSEAHWQAGYAGVYKFPDTGRLLYVQPFSALVDGIHRGGRGWRP